MDWRGDKLCECVSGLSSIDSHPLRTGKSIRIDVRRIDLTAFSFASLGMLTDLPVSVKRQKSLIASEWRSNRTYEMIQ